MHRTSLGGPLRFAVCLAAAVLVTAAVQAQNSIGVSFSSDRGFPDSALAADDVAGVVPQSNWNVNDGGADAAAAASGTTADITGPNAMSLTDSTGAATGATVEWASNGTWNTTNGTATGDAKLMNGYIDAIGADFFCDVTIDNIPYENYNVIVYIGSDGNGRTGWVTNGASTYSYATFSNDPSGGGGFTDADYVQTTDTGNAHPNANYATFFGQSSSVTIEIIRGSNNSGIHGIQIVEADGPPSVPLSPYPFLAVFLLGGIWALRRRSVKLARSSA